MPDPTSTVQGQPSPPSSRHRLMAAAEALMYARGYEAVGVAELCQQADIRRGSFYFHFPSKQALALEMLARSWQRTRATLFEPTFGDPGLPPVEAVVRYSELLAQHLERQLHDDQMVAGCRFGNFAAELSTRDPLIREQLREVFDEMIDLVAASIQRGVATGQVATGLDPRQAALDIIAHMEGLMVLSKARQQPDLLRRLGAAARRWLEADVPDQASRPAPPATDPIEP